MRWTRIERLSISTAFTQCRSPSSQSPIMEPQSVHAHSSRMTAKQAREAVSLLDLPDELLVQVIDELDGIDLYTLSVQCKRLQRLSLPLYLQSLGIATPLIFPMDHLVISEQQLHVHGFPLVFFGKTVRRLSCGFMTSSFSNTLALQRLHRMVMNIEGLEDVVLYFNYWDFETFGTRGPFTNACINLLAALTERCACLTLDHFDTYASVAYNEELVEKEATKWRRGGHSLLKDPFKALGKRFSRGISRSRSPHVPGTHPPRSRALKTLSFQSSTFLLPPFTGWAFNVLNTTPLTTLDLVGELQSQTFALVFGALTIPTLKCLRVISCRSALNFVALAEFLSRHDTILGLEIHSQPSSVHPLPITTLPALVILTSNPNGLVHLLAPTGVFPKLTMVCVVIRPSHNNQFAFDAVEASLEPIAQRLMTAEFRLCLDILPESQTHEWVSLSSLSSDFRNYPTLSRVREIVIAFFPTDVFAASVVSTWLSRFQSLEHIEFTGMPTNVEYEIKMCFLRRIARLCTRIRTVKIEDDTRDMFAWLWDS